jgi:pilus assembly protein CpaB
MNNRALTLSALMGVLGVFFVESYVQSIEEEAKRKFGVETMVWVAKRDIREMETVTEEMLDLKAVPNDFAEPSAVKISPDATGKARSTSLRAVAGSVAIVPIKRNEQITLNKLTEPGMRTGLATQVAPGRRAVSIPVNDFTAASKLLKPGDRVDLVGIIDGGGPKENRVAKTLLQDVVVLSTGRYVTNNVARLIENDTGGGQPKIKSLAEDFTFNSVTLEVDPLQAQMLVLLSSMQFNLHLVLRNNDDSERPMIQALTLTEVLGPDIMRIRLQTQGAPNAPRR